MSQTPHNSSMDQAYLKGRTRLVVCTLNPANPPVITSLIKLMQSQSAVDFSRVSAAEGISGATVKCDRVIAVITLTEKEEIVAVLQFLKTEETRITRGNMRVIVLTRMNHPKIVNALKSKGVSEVLEFHVTIKALNLKIRNQILLLNQVIERQSQERRNSNGVSGSGTERTRTEGGAQVVWEPAYEHPCEFWVLTSKKNVRFVMGRWLIDIFGPGPSAGSWESTDLTWRGEIGWQWKPRDPNNVSFQKEKGSWVFFGRVPEFVWQKNLWSLVGKFPTMAFYSGGEAKFYRMKCEQHQVLMFRENSENAKDMLEEIKATLDSSLRLNDDSKTGSGFNRSLGRKPQESSGPSITTERPDSRSLGFVHATSSAAAPSPAWQEHMETEGVDLGPGVTVPVEVPKASWGGSSLLEPTAQGAALGLADLSATGVRTDGTVFETLKLVIELRAKNGVSLARATEFRLIDYRDGEALFDTDANLCTKDDFIELKAILTLGGRQSLVEVHGTVTLADPSSSEPSQEDRRSLVALQLPEEVRKRFETIIRVFQERQIEMNHFFRMARGA